MVFFHSISLHKPHLRSSEIRVLDWCRDLYESESHVMYEKNQISMVFDSDSAIKLQSKSILAQVEITKPTFNYRLKN